MSKAASCAGAVAYAAALMVSCADAADTVSLVAVAEDTQSIVLRDERDTLHHHRAGELLGAAWRLSRVHGDVAYFQSQHPVAGKALTLVVRTGERFELGPPPADAEIGPIPLAITVRAQGRRP